MECNAKWDWESFVSFGPKAIGSPKKLQLADWMIVDDNNAASFNLSAFDGNNSVASVSDGRSSILSASTESTPKDGIGMQTQNFRFPKVQDSSGNFNKKMEMKLLETSPKPEASIGSAEPLIGLKLGKRTYFENSSGGGTVNKSTTALKKTKSSVQNARICCQVQGCNTDLSMAKEYHRKHRVCGSHSKYPKVIVGGFERRFCQQCSRFHSLSEFDEKKRSCRRRLSDHNARRRKPQQETFRFNSPFYVGSKQMSFLMNSSPTPESNAWDNSGSNSRKFTLTKGSSNPFKYYGDGVADEQLHTPAIKLQGGIYNNMQNAADNGILAATKNATSDVFTPDAAAPGYERALSLLSSNNYNNNSSSCQQESIPLPRHPIMLENNSTIATQPIPEAVPLSSSEYWLTGQQQHFTTHSHFQSLPTNTTTTNYFHEFKPPYEFYPNIY